MSDPNAVAHAVSVPFAVADMLSAAGEYDLVVAGQRDDQRRRRWK